MTELAVAAAYRFVELEDAAQLRPLWLRSCAEAGLRGTILLAPEGLNFTLAGPAAALQGWLLQLQQDPRFAQLPLKLHSATRWPFERLKVKLKREIIRMNEAGVQPAAGRAPTVGARTLRRWLAQGHCDEGRPVVLLDTRNQFEVQAGHFEGALDWSLTRFGEFPQALQQHQAELAGKTVVSYCTGGIRCEKAALWMAQQGLPHVLQLDGGILGYFEALPDAPHWQGHCVVFDQRGALDPKLNPLVRSQTSPGIEEVDA